MKHLDAAAHTRGESLYVDDVRPPSGMLHAAVFGSPVAHGELLAEGAPEDVQSNQLVIDAYLGAH